MTSATERWQENAPYTADRGSSPAAARTGLTRLGRPLLIAFICFMSALMGVATYASRGSNLPNPADRAEAASVTSEPAKRRSYTRNVISETMPPLLAVAEASAREGIGHNTLSDPVTTGSVSVPAAEDALIRARRIETARPSKQPTLRQAAVSSAQSVAKARSRTASARGRPNRSERLWALRSGSRRVVAAAPARTVTVCLVFIGCI